MLENQKTTVVTIIQIVERPILQQPQNKTQSKTRPKISEWSIVPESS